MGIIEERIQESIEVKQKILADRLLLQRIEEAAEKMIMAIQSNHKILFCGNGGSASDAAHLTGELVGRFQRDRRGLPAISLNADIATMTSIANDYGYEEVFARGIEALFCEGDIFCGLSTSGNSANVFRAAVKVKEKGGMIIAFLGRDGGKIRAISDIPLIVPSDCTARIQEAHIMIGHILCELIENEC